MTHINPALPSVGDSNWGAPLLNGIGSVVTKVNIDDDRLTVLETTAPPTATGAAGGDLSGTYPNPSLKVVGPTGTYGSATQVPVITTDGKGRITGLTTAAITTGGTGTGSGGAPSGSAGGDLTGTYPNPTLASITTAGTYGSASQVPIITTDAKGRVTAVSTIAVASGGGGSAGRTYGIDTRDYGAKWDGTTDDSAAWQAAVNALPSGGTIICPDGVSVAAGIQLHSGIAIKGVGGNRNAFGGTGRGTVISHPSVAPTAQPVTHIVVNNAGTGYSSPPTISFSGGGGSGLAAVAYVSGGAIQTIRITASGSGYTSAPTVNISGGGGSGATATAQRYSAMFYQDGTAYSDAISFSDITLVGNSGFNTVGIFLGNSWFTRITRVDTYFFPAEAIWILQGGGPHIEDCQLFGAARTGTYPNDPTGTLRIGSNCSDALVINCEIGGGYSGDQANLPNAALLYEGTAGNFVNLVCEGTDVGVRLTGVNARFMNVRADINYGHGWYLVRDIASNQPPLNNYINNCWGHNNSKYGNNLFSNFYLTADPINNRFNMCFSDATGAPVHKYGFFCGNNANGNKVYTFDDFGAGTAAISGATVLLS